MRMRPNNPLANDLMDAFTQKPTLRFNIGVIKVWFDKDHYTGFGRFREFLRIKFLWWKRCWIRKSFWFSRFLRSA